MSAKKSAAKRAEPRLRQSSRKAFLAHVRAVARYWSDQDGNKLDCAEGVAFSILVALDGGALALSPMEVRLIRRNGTAGPNIAGGLHDAFYEKKARAAQ